MMFYLAAVILIAQQAADALITQRTISSGAGSETSPIAAWMLARFGAAGLWLQKAIIFPVIAGFAYIGPPWQYAMWLLVLFYGVVLFSNWRVLKGQRSLF